MTRGYNEMVNCPKCGWLIESVPDVGRPRFVALCDEIVASLNEEQAA